MFCSKCGSENQNDAKFCEKCGNPFSVKQEKVVVEDNQILLKVKPTYKFVYNSLATILKLFIAMIFVAVCLCVYIGIGAGILISILILALASIGIVWFDKKTFEAMTYDFYRTKLVYRDSFLNIAEKEVKYKYIRETIVSQGVFERMFGIGKIALFTNAETGMSSGILLRNIENVQEYYQNIKKIINS